MILKDDCFMAKWRSLIPGMDAGKMNYSLSGWSDNTSCYACSSHGHSWAYAVWHTPQHSISQTKAWPHHTIDPFGPQACFLWKMDTKDAGGCARALVLQAVQRHPEHASRIKASRDTSRNSELVLTLSTRTLAPLLAQLLDKILFCYMINFSRSLG